jgi:hypothetical protein
MLLVQLSWVEEEEEEEEEEELECVESEDRKYAVKKRKGVITDTQTDQHKDSK